LAALAGMVVHLQQRRVAVEVDHQALMVWAVLVVQTLLL
jgi:hypothetical protein